jgi:anti-sigma regulatory factor (Ser/Thr protein kinase)
VVVLWRKKSIHLNSKAACPNWIIYVRTWKILAKKIGLSKKLIFEINLALDELFTNIISYGFKDEEEHIIKVTIKPQNEELCLCIEDDGVPFNPIDFETPDVACSVENCKIGGLGIHIMRKLMDEICYQRCDDKNILTLKKTLSNEAP